MKVKNLKYRKKYRPKSRSEELKRVSIRTEWRAHSWAEGQRADRSSKEPTGLKVTEQTGGKTGRGREHGRQGPAKMLLGVRGERQARQVPSQNPAARASQRTLQPPK